MDTNFILYVIGAIATVAILVLIRKYVLSPMIKGMAEQPRSLISFVLDIIVIVVCIGLFFYVLSRLEESAQLIAILITVLSGAFIFTSEGWLQDMLAGVSLQFSGLYKAGDLITVSDNRGRVTNLGLFRTDLETIELDIISVRNSDALQNTVINHSAIEFREIVLTVHTAGYGGYEDDIHSYVADVQEIAQRTQKEICPEALDEGHLQALAYFMEFGSSSDFINVVFYTYDQDLMYRPAMSAMHMAMAAELRPKGVVLGQVNANTIDNVLEYRRMS